MERKLGGYEIVVGWKAVKRVMCCEAEVGGVAV